MEPIALSSLTERADTATGVGVRAALPTDAPVVHALYEATPDYFRIISIPTPTLDEVRRELETAAADSRRHTELVLGAPGLSGIVDSQTGQQVVGYLDYKMHYPDNGDVMVNLLLIMGRLQSCGLGRSCVSNLERRLSGRARRVLASIYGQNPRAERFWKTLGYRFAIDAQPILDWYAKDLE